MVFEFILLLYDKLSVWFLAVLSLIVLEADERFEEKAKELGLLVDISLSMSASWALHGDLFVCFLLYIIFRYIATIVHIGPNIT